MININNKRWDILKINDIKKLLENDDDETFFFEYKDDRVSSKKFIEEVSAFANTYGGYILLGIDDDKQIIGCTEWTEQKIHNIMHNCITPIPDFDIKKFKDNERSIFVIKIEEGTMPPYITNTGKIYERISSGSFPIKDSNKLTQLYYRRQDQLDKIRNKISIEEFKYNNRFPQNICGYLDLGFSVSINDLRDFQKKFFKFDVETISNILKENDTHYSMARVGNSLVISVGEVKSDQLTLIDGGMNNFIEIMADGSVKCRIMIFAKSDSTIANVAAMFYIPSLFATIYKEIMGNNFYKCFINAYKYEQLTIIKQFIPYVDVGYNDKYKRIYDNYLKNHIKRYGNNLVITGNRIPKNDFMCIDKRFFSEAKIKYNNDNLINVLFRTNHIPLGYIDNVEGLDEINDEEADIK